MGIWVGGHESRREGWWDGLVVVGMLTMCICDCPVGNRFLDEMEENVLDDSANLCMSPWLDAALTLLRSADVSVKGTHVV